MQRTKTAVHFAALAYGSMISSMRATSRPISILKTGESRRLRKEGHRAPGASSTGRNCWTQGILPRGGGSATISRSTSRVRAAGSVGLRPKGLLLSAVPALAVYAVFQQYIIKGLTAGAIK